jgi:ATP phosphoribosyltransferase regulatory subunit
MRRFAAAAIMSHQTPPGTRDILPEEMRELRRMQGALIEVFERFGYGEVATPTLEYQEVLARGDATGAAADRGRRSGVGGAPVAYRFFDERGELLAMRTDMTVPIARLVAGRFASIEPPFRFFYVGNAYRAVRPQRGQMREFMQAGIELIGAEAPAGTAEVIEVLSAALDAVGLTRAVIGLGDADLYRQLLDEVGVGEEARNRISERLAAHDLVGLEAEVDELELGAKERETLLRLPNLRGGREVLVQALELGGDSVARATRRLASTFDALAERGVAGRVQLDLGLLRDLGYYTGAIVEVYDPAVGHVLGGGGRYDELIARFGRPLPAVGFALHLERLHIAQAEEERLQQGRAAGSQPQGETT